MCCFVYKGCLQLPVAVVSVLAIDPRRSCCVIRFLNVIVSLCLCFGFVCVSVEAGFQRWRNPALQCLQLFPVFVCEQTGECNGVLGTQTLCFAVRTCISQTQPCFMCEIPAESRHCSMQSHFAAVLCFSRWTTVVPCLHLLVLHQCASLSLQLLFIAAT